jgi:hypothetical protein
VRQSTSDPWLSFFRQKIYANFTPLCHALELVPPRLCSMSRALGNEFEAQMEKIVLLCLLIGIIGVLAEIAPAAQPRR